MASPTLITPTSTPKSSLPLTTNTTVKPKPSSTNSTSRRELFFSITAVSSSLLAAVPIMVAPSALAAEDEEYVKETEEVINKVRTTITMDKNDPNVAAAVAELRDTSNSWVAKYRREKALLGRASFRDMYSALNAVSGHYISFGPTAPIPAKRRARILEEVDTAEKALKRGR
ncbi:hypothetical protein HN51_043492 [Arachis hypogaea]|uniref:Uncharacterized protein n=1 Tax=Arachis hypogaea TaxID=3818 RepID=A0A444Y6I6_ARAHY|nr:photosystem II repair protein PSB27-H1, chloroplastic [Arachis ipaensis]XP_025673651.1 photosystem II repair protein PSB27-H1, chloroplastic [Arachis hypogaea]QHN95531.1 Photosystem II repair protein-H1 [Arachis hypogaea]RYQ97505.1 hypothetical protein Ahy_B08g093555 [Arachis hypogaea]